MSQVAKHIIFIGRVQGVGFRFTAHRTAIRYRLTGYVRNLMDGTVEMLAQGSPDDIDDCMRDIEQTFCGDVTETKVEQIPFDPTHNSFKITF